MLKPLELCRGLIPEDMLSQALEQYGIIEYTTYPYLNMNGTVVPVNRVSETSRKALVQDREGNLYFLKEIPWYIRSIEHAVSVIQLQHELALQAVWVPAVQLTTSRELIVHAGNQSTLYLQSYIPNGYLYNAQPQQIRAAGAVLGEFRTKVASAYPLQTLKLPEQSPYASTKDVLVLLLKKYMQKRNEMSKEDQKNLQYFVQVCKEMVDEWSVQHADRTEAVTSIAHGDLNPMNFIFSRDGSVSALIDFDNACLTDSLVDLAEGLLTFSGITYRNGSSRFKAVHALEPQTFHQFLEGYQKHHSLLTEEIMVLPLLMGIACIRLASLGLIRGDWPVTLTSMHIDNIRNVMKASQAYLSENY
ncbi:phosphotransferase [Paenibacillus sp. FSL R5-192]|uniref:phosphotransferase n=1 Tax=Paenibacillus sp. FSL R5-192 TaxID=1226754 RepID=UPI0003E2932A|nr:phosphotransferase [Paenibacillus sp. FSL R5-192]ETT32734.1 phosphotransferase [Paenibacillus sp. FSL R5-192]